MCLAVWPLRLAAAELPPAEVAFQGKIGVTAKDSVPNWPTPVTAPAGAPNVVIVLLDDVGFGAVSTFGGAAETPVLDRLAAGGLRYNNFHTTALCSPTRAALLTGRNDHRVGFGAVMESASGYPGYDGLWKKSTVSLPEVLRRHGYSTAAFGKWHNTPYREISPVGPFDRWPTSLGFEYFYGFVVGATSQWEPPLFRNTTALEPRTPPEQSYHLTADITDEAIQWVHTHESLASDRPYFLYFATGAAHTPHHVPKDWIDRYRGRFDQGWDALREETFARQKRLGVIPSNTDLTSRPAALPAWSSLSADERKLYARQMEVYSAFIAHTDHEIGRLLEVVQRGAAGANTLVLYIVGDNGGSGEGGLEGYDVPLAQTVQERLEHLDELGGPAYDNQYSAAWAWATSTPFQWMKQVASHFGGTRNPLIISWPARIKDRGGLRSQFSHVNDVAATVYDVTGIPFPTKVDGVAQKPLDGVSFAASFDHPGVPSSHRFQYFEMMGNRALYEDGWVAAARHAIPWDYQRSEDFDKDPWELYHVTEDFSEAHDLAAQYPEKLKDLQRKFDRAARANDVYPLNNAFGGTPFGEGQPSPIAGKSEFVYYTGLPRLSTMVGSSIPDFQRSHRITARVIIPEQGAQGLLLSDGDRRAGFAFYIKDNHLAYEYHFAGKRQTIISSIDVPRGEVILGYEFLRAISETENPQEPWLANGMGRLYINERPVGEVTLSKIIPLTSYHGSFNVGEARGSPVSASYDAPFKFTGEIKEVRVLLR